MSFRLLERLYADDEMLAIWSERGSVQTWLDVEAALAQAQADVGVLERADADAISAVCRLETLDLDLLWERARVVGYPIHPLVRMIRAALPSRPAGRVHHGATTQDVMDTALSLQLGRSGDRLVDLLVSFGSALASLTEDHAGTVMAARTHAQQAVPTTFGAKLAVFLAEVTRHVGEVRRVRDEARVVSLFGAGGTSAASGSRSVQVRAALASRLGLKGADVPWHVARDRVVRFGLTCTTVAGTCVRFAREVVDLSRTEVGEVRERGGPDRGASSTMPQKANPIAAEAVIGFGVTAAGTAGSLLRALEAGHERAAGEWQVEWAALPTAAESCAAALRLSAETASSLEIVPARMAANLAADGGLLMAESLMVRLAPVLGRERAHDFVTAAAQRTRADGSDLVTECRNLLPTEVAHELDNLDLTPQSYVGEAAHICSAAVSRWRRVAGDGRAGPGEDAG